MEKVKLIKDKTPLVRLMSIQVTPELYERLGKITHDLKTTKKVIISTALSKFLDDIELYGVEL